MKLFPILATLFAHAITSKWIYGMFEDLVADVEQGKFGGMDLLHHLTSGGKSCMT